MLYLNINQPKAMIHNEIYKTSKEVTYNSSLCKIATQESNRTSCSELKGIRND